MFTFLIFFLGFLVGSLLVGGSLWLWGKAYKEEAVCVQKEKEFLIRENAQLNSAIERASMREEAQETMFLRAQEALEKAATTGWGQALTEYQNHFFALAKQTLNTFQASLFQDQHHNHTKLIGIMDPLAKALEVMDSRMRQMEQSRVGAYEGLFQQVNTLIEMQNQLCHETTKLTHALRNPQTRGRWGEFQLRRVVELAGMTPYCDFLEQETFSTLEHEGKKIVRPDMIVRMPQKHHLAIDAKVPLASYLEAAECPDESQRTLKLKDHAKQLRLHIKALSVKEYWVHLGSKIQCVVLFLPHEAFLTTALEYDTSLMEYSASCGVILATPMTLIGLFKVIAFGWSQVAVVTEAQELHQCGKELSEALHDIMQSIGQLGKHLTHAVKGYNQVAHSTNETLVECAARLRDLGLQVKEDARQASLIKAKPLVPSTFAEVYPQETEN